MECIICGSKAIVENKNNFVEKYNCPFCGVYYMEKSFKGQMENFGLLYGENESKKIKKIMENYTRENRIVFTSNFSNPYISINNAIYLEFEDLANAANVLINNTNSQEKD
ncbi:MAG: hypothetical protein PHD50_03670 [Bacilli bacterium]|jgi:ribosomal protein L37AE/L43A|nr:hypothetical protein [Bacilli bacterium]